MLSFWPSRKQWRQWSLPSKLTALGALFGLISVLFLPVTFFTTGGKNELNEKQPWNAFEHPEITEPEKTYSACLRYAIAANNRYNIGIQRGVITSPDPKSWCQLSEKVKSNRIRHARTIEKGFNELGYKFEDVGVPRVWYPTTDEFDYLAHKNYLWRCIEYTNGGGYKDWNKLSERSKQDFRDEVRETLDVLFDAGLSVVKIQ